MSIHLMASVIVKAPELNLEESEAKRLAENLAKINELYGNIVIPEKTMAWVNLTMAMGSIYGPRVMAYKLRVKKEKAEGKRPVTIDAVPSAGYSTRPVM